MRPKYCYICRNAGDFYLAARSGGAPRRAVCRRHLVYAIGRYAVVGEIAPRRPARPPLAVPHGHVAQVARLVGWAEQEPPPAFLDSAAEGPMVGAEPGAYPSDREGVR